METRRRPPGAEISTGRGPPTISSKMTTSTSASPRMAIDSTVSGPRSARLQHGHGIGVGRGNDRTGQRTPPVGWMPKRGGRLPPTAAAVDNSRDPRLLRLVRWQVPGTTMMGRT